MKKRTLVLALLALMAAMSVTGCGDSDKKAKGKAVSSESVARVPIEEAIDVDQMDGNLMMLEPAVVTAGVSEDQATEKATEAMNLLYDAAGVIHVRMTAPGEAENTIVVKDLNEDLYVIHYEKDGDSVKFTKAESAPASEYVNFGIYDASPLGGNEVTDEELERMIEQELESRSESESGTESDTNGGE